MRCLAIGDIHGCINSLDALLSAVSPRADDRIITLGDYVNRGPDSRAVLDRLIDLSKHFALISLMGNHEQMMLEARDDAEKLAEFLRNGGDRTLASYAGDGKAGALNDVPESHWKFVESCRDWYEDSTHFFVHANAYPDYPLEEQPVYMLRWERFENPAPHESGKIMICGHTPQKTGRPKILATRSASTPVPTAADG